MRRTVKGAERHINLRVSLLPGHEGSWSRIVWSMVDVTAAKTAEARLRAAIQHHEVLLKEIHHRVKNNLAVISSLFYLESRHARTGRIVRFGNGDLNLRNRGGDLIPIDDYAAPVTDTAGQILGAVVAFRDDRDRRLTVAALQRAREELFQSQKIEAVGRLAGGVAHDFNIQIQNRAPAGAAPSLSACPLLALC